MKYLIELTEGQVRVVNNALDLYSRIWMGQIEEPFSILRLFTGRYPKTRDDERSVREALETLKRVFFPELSQNAYHGIFSPETDEQAKIAWEIYQALRNKLAWTNYPEGGFTVDFNEPVKVSEKETIPEVLVVEEGESGSCG